MADAKKAKYYRQWLEDETYYLGEDLDELAYDIAYEIALKLKENDFFSSM